MKYTRREIVKSMALASIIPESLLGSETSNLASSSPENSNAPILKVIPKTGEKIPAIGMGSFRTFNVGKSNKLRQERVKVLKAFFAGGGKLIDSSQMYGTSEEVLGYCLTQLKMHNHTLSATKVWTRSTQKGKEQFQESLNFWGLKKFYLYQIHNLLNWQEHLKVLKIYKAEGKIKYLGITTSHNRHVSQIQEIMKNENLDFIQFTYNMNERWNDPETLKIAQDRGVAVIVNRPFEKGYLFDKIRNKPLPGIAKELGYKYWSEFFLKWIISHPAVTCAIPATSRIEHMKENMKALYGDIPDTKTRSLMLKAFMEI